MAFLKTSGNSFPSPPFRLVVLLRWAKCVLVASFSLLLSKKQPHFVWLGTLVEMTISYYIRLRHESLRIYMYIQVRREGLQDHKLKWCTSLYTLVYKTEKKAPF